MKPVYIRFKAFGPYLEEQKIDLTRLETAGLFLICGETGGGKTTILDAITYALYGKSSGGGRGGLETMRCNLASREQDTEIEYVFEENRRRYQFIRTVKQGRKNLNCFQNSLVMDENGIFSPLHENPTASIIDGNTKNPGDAQRIIGLSYEQFCQVIILPQGQFEKLLTADSAEKEKILVSIFKAEKWQQLSELVYDKARKEWEQLKNQQNDMIRRLADYGYQDFNELQAGVEKKRAEYEEGARRIADISRVLKEKELEVRQFEQLEQDLDRDRKLTLEKSTYENLKLRLVKAEKADKLKPQIERMQLSAQEEQKRQRNLKQSVARAEIIQKKYENLKSDSEIHAQKKHQMDEAMEETIQYEALTENYARAAECAEKLKESEMVLKLCEEDFKQKKSGLDQRKSELLMKQETQQIMMQKHQQLYHEYIKNISGTLAMKLVKGAPCPVCGSMEHPFPAAVTGKTVTDEMLKDQEQKLGQIQKQIDQKRMEVETAQQEAEAANMKKIQTEQRKSQTKAEFDTLSSRKVNGIATLEQLSTEIRRRKKLIEEYKKKSENLEQELREIQGQLISAQESKRQAETEWKDADRESLLAVENLEAALAEYGLESAKEVIPYLISADEKEKLHGKLASYLAEKEKLSLEITKLTELLRDREKPDRTEFTLKRDALIRENAILEKEIREQENFQNTQRSKYESYMKKIQKAEMNLQFARQLRGDTGVGIQRYVLGVMLSAITREANKLLEHVHGGRYRLYRTVSKSGTSRKAGLELEVHDANAGNEGRGVRGLSGGEKFLVALSLSIGLSTVAQKRGMKLDSMFIDEGFGSLDDKSIGDALGVLGHIQKANGLVGIISHVQVLRDNIPAHIEIIKSSRGSSLKISV